MAKITVNESCIGCGTCVGVAPDVFEMNDEGLSSVIGDDVDSAKKLLILPCRSNRSGRLIKKIESYSDKGVFD